MCQALAQALNHALRLNLALQFNSVTPGVFAPPHFTQKKTVQTSRSSHRRLATRGSLTQGFCVTPEHVFSPCTIKLHSNHFFQQRA